MNNKIIKTAFAAAITLVSWNSYADFSGFSSLVEGRTFGDESPPIEEFALASDSFLGLQTDMRVNDNISSVFQVISNNTGAWEMDITLSYLSFSPLESWDLVFGRQAMPHYFYSEDIALSHRYHWIAAPGRLYDAPFTSFNGISSRYQFNFDQTLVEAQILYGQEPDYGDNSGNAYTKIKGGKVIFNHDWLTVNSAYFEFVESSSNNGELENELRAGVIKSFDFATQIEYKEWLFTGEFIHLDSTALDKGIKQPWMISLAKPFASVTPHLTYGVYREIDTAEDDVIPFYIAGVRWDVSPTSALKFEYASEKSDHTKVSSMQLALVTIF